MEEQSNKNEKSTVDPFSRFMFGPGREVTNTIRSGTRRPESQETVDFDELLMNFEALMDSASKLKPFFRKIYPVVEQFWKKN